MKKQSRSPTLRKRRRAGGRITTHAKLSGVFLSFGDADDPQSRVRFAAAVALWERAGRKVTDAVIAAAAGRGPGAGDENQVAGVTLHELAKQYESYLDTTGRHRKHGAPTPHRGAITKALDEFVGTFGDLDAAHLSAAILHRHRDALEASPKLTRRGINRKVAILVGCCRWGWKRGLVPTPAWADLRLVEPLTRSEAGNRPQGFPKRIPTLDEIRKLLPHCSRQVAGMVRLQVATGMRPCEVCALRFEDVEVSIRDGVRFGVYRVQDAKTSHHGTETSYVLNHNLLALLDEFRRPGGGIVFRPCDAMSEWSAKRRAKRQTPATAQMHRRDAAPHRRFREFFAPITYRQAVERACALADVPKFVPHALRHLHASWCANHPSLGVGAASSALNHVSAASTQHYLHRDDALRFTVASLAARELAV